MHVQRLPAAAQVDFHHRGLVLFKGIDAAQPLIQISSSHLAARDFADGLPSKGKKGRLVAPPEGLRCSVFLS